ncbi:hypothetical protein CNY67_11390 [Desulfovibrio sp. G11]|nr:hypothetical protein CNY67_11390 [Desulfovibrio sp. G11]
MPEALSSGQARSLQHQPEMQYAARCALWPLRSGCSAIRPKCTPAGRPIRDGTKFFIQTAPVNSGSAANAPCWNIFFTVAYARLPARSALPCGRITPLVSEMKVNNRPHMPLLFSPARTTAALFLRHYSIATGGT